MRKRLIITAAAAFSAVALLTVNQVPRTATTEDVQAIRRLLPEPRRVPRGFDAEVAFIFHVQDRVLGASPDEWGIELNRPREIKDLIIARHGACYDRSRAIETILRFYGFSTRHASMYSTEATGSALKSLVTPLNLSHALTEVETSRGWMIVDSRTRWAGLTSDGQPLDLAAIRQNPRRKWHVTVKAELPEIYRAPYTWLYGVYSRHGRFFPPYNAIPDVNWPEMAQNL